MVVPGFPSDFEWEHMNPTQKCNALAKAVDQVWSSMVLTGQQIMSEPAPNQGSRRDSIEQT